MRVLDKGHKYELNHLDGSQTQTIQFCNREGGTEQEGCTTQEVIRVLIDRTYYCNDCLPWSGNEHIVNHLRMALALHEARAFIRGVEKGEIKPEFLVLGSDGHMRLEFNEMNRSRYARMPMIGTETGSLNPGVCLHQFKKKIEDQERADDDATMPF